MSIENELKKRVQEPLSCLVCETGGDGVHVELTLVSAEFSGLSSLKRQQKVYALIQDLLASGALHAIQMTLFSKEEWEEKNG